ncbi:hypothetical protein [Micromonospora sp. NPDC049497]|uniref:hypothetical protein n=1 Tax=Micromonospora sp. NPDC049497 TaxID=3364273 RepID=UPI0037AC09B6
MLAPPLWLAGWLATAELGDVATWISAIANVATVVLALVASLVGLRIYRIESGRDQRAEDERRERAAEQRRHQAASVSVWYAFVVAPVPPNIIRQRPLMAWAAQILNASTLPVYDVRLVFHGTGTTKASELAAAADPIRVVPPHQEPVTVAMPRALRTKVPYSESDSIEVSLEFRDAAGRRWLRDRNGFLLDVTPMAATHLSAVKQ